MASVVTSPSVLSGLFKEVYGAGPINLVPEVAKLVKMIPFVSSDKELGNKYHQMVVTSLEGGVSYAAADAGAFDLNESISMATQDAYVQGSQVLLRSALSYDAASRASNDKKAFQKVTQLLVENMVETLNKRLEIGLLYGQSGIAAGTTGAKAGSGSSEYVVLTVSDAEWAPGIWAGMENTRVTCKVSSSYYGPFKVKSVDFDNKTVTLQEDADAVTGETGDADNIASATIADVFFYGAVNQSTGAHREQLGLDGIITTSGTLMGIANTTYALWKGNSVTVSGQLTMGKIFSSLNKPINKGLDEEVTAFVSPATWANLSSDQAALRYFDSSYKGGEAENGFESIKYRYQNGLINVVAHSCVKEGECFIIPIKRFKRVGAQNVSFKTPGMGDDIFLHLQNKAGYEIRVYTDQALFPEAVAKCLKISGFTNI